MDPLEFLGMQPALEVSYGQISARNAIVKILWFAGEFERISKRIDVIIGLLLISLLIPGHMKRDLAGISRLPLVGITIWCLVETLQSLWHFEKYQLEPNEEYLYGRSLLRLRSGWNLVYTCLFNEFAPYQIYLDIPQGEIQSWHETHTLAFRKYTIVAQILLIEDELGAIFGSEESRRLLRSFVATMGYSLWTWRLGLTFDDPKLFFLVYSQPIAIGGVLVLWVILLCLHMVKAGYRGQIKSFVTKSTHGVHISNNTLAYNIFTMITRVSNNLLGNSIGVLGESDRIKVPRSRLRSKLSLQPRHGSLQPLTQLAQRQWGANLREPQSRSKLRLLVQMCLQFGLGIQITFEFVQCLVDLWSLGVGLFENLSYGTIPDEIENASEDRSSICVVCYVSPRKVVLWPCGCLCLCIDCKRHLKADKCLACQRKLIGFSLINLP